MSTRKGVSITELLVVFAILSLLLALLIPAVQRVRVHALETVCKNNLHQINLAAVQFTETQKRIPGPSSPGVIGGWTIDVLPFLEQQNVRDSIKPGNSIQTAPAILFRPPSIFRCPNRSVFDAPTPLTMDPSHYVFVPMDVQRKNSFSFYDAPLELKQPWASGPEINSYTDVIRQTGPHNRGFFYASGFSQGVGFYPKQ